MIILKNIVLLFISLVTILFFTFPLQSDKDTEVIITIPNLTHKDISLYLRNEFNKYSHIEYIDGSIATKSIVLNVNQHEFDQDFVEDLLNKWGCSPSNFDFNSLAIAISD